MNSRAQKILWLDCSAACAAGVAMLALHEWFAALYGFSTGLVLFFGLTNLAYASYSGSLAVRARLGTTAPRRAVDVLIGANVAWVVICLIVLLATWRTATPFGVAHATLEALFVGILARAELRSVRPFAAPRQNRATDSHAIES